MPSFSFDISDEVRNIIDAAIKEGGPGDFNPGQRAAWSAVTCEVSGKATVRIAGADVDISADVSVQCTGADYISEAVKNLEGIGELIGSSIEGGHYFLTDQLINQAFKQL